MSAVLNATPEEIEAQFACLDQNDRMAFVAYLYFQCWLAGKLKPVTPPDEHERMLQWGALVSHRFQSFEDPLDRRMKAALHKIPHNKRWRVTAMLYYLSWQEGHMKPDIREPFFKHIWLIVLGAYVIAHQNFRAWRKGERI